MTYRVPEVCLSADGSPLYLQATDAVTGRRVKFGWHTIAYMEWEEPDTVLYFLGGMKSRRIVGRAGSRHNLYIDEPIDINRWTQGE